MRRRTLRVLGGLMLAAIAWLFVGAAFTPLPPDAPILKCRQIVCTPHNADMTPEGVDALNAGMVDNAINFLEGKPQNVVN